MHAKLDIEALVHWALRGQGMGWTGQGGSLMELGTRIDISPRGSVAPPSAGLLDHEDAPVVAKAILALPAEAAALVWAHGRAGTRPVADEAYGAPAQAVDAQGRPRWRYRDPVNCKGRLGPVYDWRGYGAHCELVTFDRAQYALWWEGLAELVRALPGQLRGHEATGPAAPRAPWVALFGDDAPMQFGAAPEDTPDVSPEALRAAAAGTNGQASDWGAPGTGERPARGALEVVYVAPVRRSVRNVAGG